MAKEFTPTGKVRLGREMHIMIFTVYMVKANEGSKEGSKIILNRSYSRNYRKWILGGQD